MENKINWFPGHMASALKMMSAELKLCDVIIYVLDARCAVSCLNPEFEKLTERKPVVFVLNKADLAAADAVREFKKYSGNQTVIPLDATRSGSAKAVVSSVERLAAEKINNAKAKGVRKIIRAMVIGVTNCGKSTLINNLCGKGKTMTADRPGVTRTKQWAAAGDYLWVLDTPGTLWPKFDDAQIAKNLAYVGSIKDDVIDILSVSKELLADLLKLDKGCLEKRFGVNGFDEICRKRGCILKNGALDTERAAKAILSDFRTGKIGRFNLDKLIGV